MAELTQEYVLSLFTYRDGNLFWRESRGNQVKAGDIAGTIRKDKYSLISINNELYLSHRLIFLYHDGVLPEFLDHIDGNPSNNAINNLREATTQENHRNRKKCLSMNGKLATSKYKGVTWDKHHKKWRNRIWIDGKQKHLGYFTSEIEAAKAYNRAAIKYFGEFACLNILPQPL